MNRYFKRNSERDEVMGLNMTSLPDLIFTVLFFFMIVTHMREVNLKVHYEVPQGTEVQKLGHKASHGCIRVQRLENADGYNHLWLWNNLKGQKNVKIIVWDDDGRKLAETPAETPMYYNPKGGVKYHTNARCSSVKSTYLPLTGITYGDLSRYPFTELSPCGVCGAPERPETVARWNWAIDQARMQLMNGNSPIQQ